MRKSALVAELVAATTLGAALLAGCDGSRDPGARVWSKRCQQCHGEDGRGRTKFAEGRPYADLTDDRWKHGPEPEKMRLLIVEGEPKSPMPPFEGRLSPEEIDAVVRHMLTLIHEARPAPERRP